ncbi:MULTISPECIES: hypothetical protein [Burkholderia]|uniref:hypothetical protein n=1 Tax=Burkholderia TaxID=32008 RepID=UPI00068F91AE|nr:MULTISPECIES: hypothetical protein [Burkholderia]
MAHQGLFAASELSTRSSPVDVLDDELERVPRQFTWVPFFTAFLLLAYLVSTWVGIRMIFFPPLVVIAFEMFAHADIWPWAQRPIILPCVCMITAAAGVAALALFGPGFESTILAMLAGVVTLRLSRVYVTPALAVGLLPQVMPHANWIFPLAVGIGSALLTLSFLTFRQFSSVDQRVPD